MRCAEEVKEADVLSSRTSDTAPPCCPDAALQDAPLAPTATLPQLQRGDEHGEVRVRAGLISCSSHSASAWSRSSVGEETEADEGDARLSSTAASRPLRWSLRRWVEPVPSAFLRSSPSRRRLEGEGERERWRRWLEREEGEGERRGGECERLRRGELRLRRGLRLLLRRLPLSSSRCRDSLLLLRRGDESALSLSEAELPLSLLRRPLFRSALRLRLSLSSSLRPPLLLLSLFVVFLFFRSSLLRLLSLLLFLASFIFCSLSASSFSRYMRVSSSSKSLPLSCASSSACLLWYVSRDRRGLVLVISSRTRRSTSSWEARLNSLRSTGRDMGRRRGGVEGKVCRRRRWREMTRRGGKVVTEGGGDKEDW